MIFVTVGLHNQQFNRLLNAVDGLIASGKIKEDVVMQIGNSTYEPKHAKWFKFSDLAVIKKYIKKSSLVISHGGAGSLILALHHKKPIVAVPRLKKFNEHFDDHQIELVRELENQRYVTVAYDIRDLNKSIKNVKNLKKVKTKNKKILQIVERYLEEIKK